MIAEKTISKEIKRMVEINKIDGLVGAKNVGAIVDLHNQRLDAKKDREFSGDLTDRNKYFAPLWMKALEEISLGHKAKPKEKYVSPVNKIFLPNRKKVVVK